MAAKSIKKVVVASSEQISSDLDGESIIFSLKSGNYYNLNEIAAKIWHIIQKPRTVKEIRDLLLTEYQFEPSRCEQEVIKLLRKLLDWELIEIIDIAII